MLPDSQPSLRLRLLKRITPVPPTAVVSPGDSRQEESLRYGPQHEGATLTSIGRCRTAGQTDWPSGETGHSVKGARRGDPEVSVRPPPAGRDAEVGSCPDAKVPPAPSRHAPCGRCLIDRHFSSASMPGVPPPAAARADPILGPPLKADLSAGITALPTWMREFLKPLIECDAGSGRRAIDNDHAAAVDDHDGPVAPDHNPHPQRRGDGGDDRHCAAVVHPKRQPLSTPTARNAKRGAIGRTKV